LHNNFLDSENAEAGDFKPPTADAAESISATVTFFKSLPYICKTGIQSSFYSVESVIKVEIRLSLQIYS